MKVIVCNIGSSSLKFQLLDMPNEVQLTRGHFERVVSEEGQVTFWIGDQVASAREKPIRNHREAVQDTLDFLLSSDHGLVSDAGDVAAVGFKCVQAGEKNGSVILGEEVLQAMEEYRDLAPAHNPPYLEAIHMFRELMPATPLVGVFEPGFHMNAPEYTKVYGVPYEWIEKYGVRKYGYHGASHRFVTGETVRILNLSSGDHKIISCHLGGSSSLCAFRNGVSVDNSMGFSPQSGLLQGTRVGDIDAFVLPYIMNRKGISLERALEECSKGGGLAGLSGTSGDMRDIVDAIGQGSSRARLARDKFIYDVKRYIGEHLVIMEGVDAITFTGGIGQKDAGLRADVLGALSFLGLQLDEEANAAHSEIITTPKSEVAALVLETNEEIVVARETVAVISAL